MQSIFPVRILHVRHNHNSYLQPNVKGDNSTNRVKTHKKQHRFPKGEMLLVPNRTTASIPPSHGGDPGSTPGLGTFLPPMMDITHYRGW